MTLTQDVTVTTVCPMQMTSALQTRDARTASVCPQVMAEKLINWYLHYQWLVAKGSPPKKKLHILRHSLKYGWGGLKKPN